MEIDHYEYSVTLVRSHDLLSQLYATAELNDITILGEVDKPGPQRLLHSTWQEAYWGLRLLLFDMWRGSLAGWVARARGCKMSEDTCENWHTCSRTWTVLFCIVNSWMTN